MCIRLTRPTTWVYQKQTENPIKYGPQSYLQSDAPDLIYLQKLRCFLKNLDIQNKFFWLCLQFKQKGDQPKTRWKEKHSLSGLWVPLNFCKEIVVLRKEQELKVGAQQKS